MNDYFIHATCATPLGGKSFVVSYSSVSSHCCTRFTIGSPVDRFLYNFSWAIADLEKTQFGNVIVNIRQTVLPATHL